MSDRDKSKDQLIEELNALRRDARKLKLAKIGFDAQTELLRTIATMGRATTSSLMLRAILQQALKIANQMVSAEEGSFLLLDTDGKVIESILSRGVTMRENKQHAIGTVLDRGLAGWVYRNRQVGLVSNTAEDERWVTLPAQPYQVGSALCVPLIRNKVVLGILTLMHSQSGHFTSQSVRLLEAIAPQFALVLDNARVYLHAQNFPEPTPQPQLQTPVATPTPTAAKPDLSKTGIYIILGNGHFLYANSRLAEIFDYSFGELVGLESAFELASSRDRDRVKAEVERCIYGKETTLSLQFQGQGKDGSKIDVVTYGNRTKFYGKTVVIGILRKA